MLYSVFKKDNVGTSNFLLALKAILPRTIVFSVNLMESRAGCPIVCVTILSTGGIHSIL